MNPRVSKPIRSMVAMFLFFWLAACSTYPLGMSEAEWLELTPEQRLQVREKQLEHDRLNEQRRLAEAAARREEARQQAAELETRRQQARYGERLQCVLQPAEAWLNRKWREIEPLAFDLLVGHEQALPLQDADRRGVRYSSRAFARFDGQQLMLCQQPHEPRQRGRCLRELGTFNDYRRGIQREVEVDQFLRGRLRCSLVP
jgi:hypothetical protein